MDATRATALPGQDAAHPDGQYGTIAKWFHWITVGLIAIALPTGFVIKFITEASDSVYKMGFYAIHESAGLTILFASLARILWKATHKAPPHPPELPAFMHIAATATHHGLYTLLIVQPILGFFATNAWGFPLQGQTAYLGFIELPTQFPAGTMRRVAAFGRGHASPPVRGCVAGAECARLPPLRKP